MSNDPNNHEETEASSPLETATPGKRRKKGLVIAYTGDGKGKTTAALGLALRATGYDLKVLMIQFIKGDWHYGELDAVKRLSPYFELIRTGRGFTAGPLASKATPEEHQQAAQEGLKLAHATMAAGTHTILILDEIFGSISADLITTSQLVELIHARPSGLSLILTGRGAPPEIIELSDLVTEMREIKHPYQQGIMAQKGIDF